MLTGWERSEMPAKAVASSPRVTSMVCTHEFREIILTEDEELLGMRFLRPKGLSDSNFKVDLFIAKAGGLEGESIPLVERMIQ